MLLALALAAAALAAPEADPPGCPALDPALAHAESVAAASPAADAAAAAAAMAPVEQALACAPPASPAAVARVLRVQGALWFRQGAAEEARLAFASAARIDPAGWTEGLGAELRQAFDAAGAQTDRLGSGRLSLSPAPPAAFGTWLDGAAQELPAFVPSGLHLVQVVAPFDAPVAPGRARSARLALVFDQDDLVVDPGPVPLQPAWMPTDGAAPPRGPSRARVTLLASGGALAVGGGVTAMLARAQAGRAERASADFLQDPPSEARFAAEQRATLDEIDKAEAAQKVWATSTWALLGLGATAVSVAFVF